MKSLLIFFGVCVFFCSCKSWEDTMVENKIIRKENKEIEKLLTATVDVHRMLLEQGKLMRDRGTSSPIRECGDLIVANETALLSKIETLSHIKNLKLSSHLSTKRAQVLTQLKDLDEKDFEKKSLKIIASQYKQNLEEIEKAPLTYDPSIKELLSYQTSMMQELSTKIEIIKQEQAEKHFSMRAKYRAWNRGYMLSLIIGQFLI